MATITLSDKMPEIPEADFAFEINFKKGEGSASRVFLATHEFIKFCERFDSDLLNSIDSSIQPLLTLENIETGSIKTWLRNRLTAVDDSALKDLNWKRIIGSFLVDAKYAMIRWSEKDEKIKSVNSIIDEIEALAQKTAVRYFDDYPKLKADTVITAAKNLQTMKNFLLPNDEVKFISREGEIEINMNYIIPIDSIEDLVVARTIVSSVNLILPIKKPDFLAETRWEMRHGKQNISAKIDDIEWLRRFRAREYDLRPGDALECEVEIEYSYGEDNELINEKFRIIKIKTILPKQASPKLPFMDDL